jgi:hypothetical protein
VTDSTARAWSTNIRTARPATVRPTSTGYVFLLDPWWNPAVEAHAVDRAHRIGQQRKAFS